MDSEKIPQEKLEGEPLPESWPKHGKVSFKDVSLRYRPKTAIVLKDLTFDIEPGQKIGICGRTGAGKSTIALTLSRIIELEKGTIEIDGVDISSLDLKELRSKITVIPQDPTLFKGTLKFNLDPFEVLPNEKLEEVLKKAGLDDLLSRGEKEFCHGLNFKVDEGGSNLSVGEKQLLCICRSILRHNKVVILDEATANIDVVTEQRILELISTEF